MIWIAIALVLLATVVAIALPVLSARAPQSTTADHDLAVFADQMSELDRDRDRDLINAVEYDAARAEIGRRILLAERSSPARNTAARSGRSNLAVAIGVLLIVPLAATPVYLWRGNPSLVGAAVVADSRPAAAAREAETMAGLQESVTRLKARLAVAPEDFDGWVLLGRSYMVTQEPLLAIEAYGKAIALRPDDGAVRSFLGEAVVFSAAGTVTEAAQSAFRRALANDPSDPAARFYLALGDAQAGNLRDAFDDWLNLAGDTPPDAPWRPMLMQQLQAAAEDLGIDLATALPQGRAPALTQGGRGPSREDVEAAQDMSPQDRDQMIRGMVASLAARLEENPNDAEGWERLARSYRVLGETAKAADAEARALAARQPTGGPSGPTRQTPTPDSAESAPSGQSDDTQQEMIEGMVAGLAARLEETPQDREGWLRLTRSYEVLGKTDLALQSFEKAATHFPEDVEILQLFARAVVNQAAADAALPTRAFNLYRRVLEIQRGNPEALYFVGLGEAERDNQDEARRHWTSLLETLEPESDARAIVQQRLRALSSP
jgi:cytochrome c-type biogenesis protein CcmH